MCSFHRFPWDQKTVYGFLLTTIIFNVFVVSATLIAYGYLAFFVGISDYHQSFAEFFLMKVERINTKISNRDHQNGEIKKTLSDAIQFQIQTKE